ncbi:PDR/VanB family oxidoreductase [Streptomyces sp. NPDC000151]|uniref:PDR/VanB family oxidoreductase n=1 Tax=Streptomyces sp. NPDC000151 TaxID=3154244 RepID=UPI003329B5B3
MHTVTVTDVVEETDAVRRYRLARPDGSPLPAYRAGAHIQVTGPTGLTRAYSLCGPPADPGAYTIAVQREPESRGGSQALHDKVAVGTELGVSDPHNLFALTPSATEHHLVGAGIGITPLLAMAYELYADGAAFALHYVARGEAEAPFAQTLAEAPFAGRVRRLFGLGRDRTAAALRDTLGALPPGSHVYTCGPAGFMDTVTRLAAHTLPEDHIHSELFRADDADDGDTDTDPGRTFEVELDGETYTVRPGRSIAEVLEEHGIPLDTSCREGICGTCVLQVLDGTPDHRDQCLSRDEKAAGDRIAACVSRARSPRLVVELW